MKMNFVSMMVVTLASASALACPNLAGRFTCRDFDNNSVQDVTITQKAIAGGQHYQIKIVADGQTQVRDYIADGKAKTVTDPKYASRTEKSYCEGTVLKVQINGVLKDTKEVLDAVVTVKIDAQNNLFDSYIGTSGGKPINFSETCARN